MTAEIDVAGDAATGAIVAQGGRTGGWALLADGGRLAYHYNYCGLLRTTVTATDPLPPGSYQVRAEFAYDGGGIGRGGHVTLYVDGEAVGDGAIKRTHPLYFSFDEGLDVGLDTGMPVYEGYTTERGRFSETINWAQIDLGDDDHNHLIPPEAHLQAALMHQ